MRLVLVLMAWSVMAQPAYNCQADLVSRWNRFATDANAYTQLLHDGGVNPKVAGRIEREFRDVTRCECWK